jgi:hypothetical protein
LIARVVLSNPMALACVAVCALALHAGSARAQPVTSWSLQLPEEQAVVFRGVVSMDSAGMGTGAILYPAPSAAGFVAAVITHGILSESIKRDQKNRLQSSADQVLSPYRSVIDSYTHRDLIQRCLPKMATPGEKRSHAANEAPPVEWVMESVPEFAMTQDRRALVLDNAVIVYRRGSRDKAAYRNSVRIVSHPAEETDPVEYWNAGEGQRLKDESAVLLAESLDIALLDMGAGTVQRDIPFKTVRYLEGGAEKMERAQVIGERCNRLLLKTLRGALMSAPPKVLTDCAAAK